MTWMDTHCHLDAPELAADLAAVRERAHQAGVGHCVIPAVAPSNFEAVRELAHRFGDSYALGIHPLWVAQSGPDALAALALALEQHAGDDRLVAVGEGGTVLTSIDGMTWTARSTPSTTWWNDVGWQSGWYCLVGDGGGVALSQDLSTWVESPTATTRNLYTVCAAGNQWIVAGNGAAILRARATAFDSPVQILNYPKTAEESLFLFGGQMDQTFRLERSTDLQTWQDASDLEITDPEGVLLLLDSITNAPDAQFFRVINP